MIDKADWDIKYGDLPGNDMIFKGITDLEKGIVSEESLLVLIVGPRLRVLGFRFGRVSKDTPYEHQLFSLIELRLDRGAHSYYNALIRRAISFLSCIRG